MRLSSLFFTTLRDDPSEAEMPSHRLLLRAGLLFLSYTCYYLAIAAIPLAEAGSLFYTAPLFIVALSGPMRSTSGGSARVSRNSTSSPLIANSSMRCSM